MSVFAAQLSLPKDKTQCVHVEFSEETAFSRCTATASREVYSPTGASMVAAPHGWLCQKHREAQTRRRGEYRPLPDREIVDLIKRTESRAIASRDQIVVNGIRQVKGKTMTYDPEPYYVEYEIQAAALKAKLKAKYAQFKQNEHVKETV